MNWGSPKCGCHWTLEETGNFIISTVEEESSGLKIEWVAKGKPENFSEWREFAIKSILKLPKMET
jgi:hypothetical protein